MKFCVSTMALSLNEAATPESSSALVQAGSSPPTRGPDVEAAQRDPLDVEAVRAAAGALFSEATDSRQRALELESRVRLALGVLARMRFRVKLILRKHAFDRPKTFDNRICVDIHTYYRMRVPFLSQQVHELDRL